MLNIFGNKSKTKGGREEDLPLENEGYPDSSKPHGLCPRCNKQSSFDNYGELPANFDSNVLVSQVIQEKRSYYDRVICLVCRNCTQPVIVLEECFIDDQRVSEGMKSGNINWRGFFWWPFTSEKLNDHVPNEITSTLNEAKICYTTKCFRAAAVMARRTLEAIAIDKDATTGSLAARIKVLSDNGTLDKNLADWATEIRLIGNNGAHFDPINNVEQIEADQIILFIDELIKYLYIMPSEIEKRRRKGKTP